MPKVLFHFDVDGGSLFAESKSSSDYIDHLSFEKSNKGDYCLCLTLLT